MSKARQNLERRYWAAPNVKVAFSLWERMSPEVRKRCGATHKRTGKTHADAPWPAEPNGVTATKEPA